jgi:putative transposase
MSLPRAIISGRRYLITRRCSERRFLMRPDRETNNAFIYCMALAARKSHVSVVCFGTTSNHYHGVVVDDRGWRQSPQSAARRADRARAIAVGFLMSPRVVA